MNPENPTGNLTSQIDERLSELGIVHDELTELVSGLNFVVTDNKSVLCKVQGLRAQAHGNIEKEIFYANYLKDHVRTTQPLLMEPIAVGGRKMGVWDYLDGRSISENDITVCEMQEVLAVLKSFHATPFDNIATIDTAVDKIRPFLDMAKDYDSSDLIEQIVRNLVDEYMAPFVKDGSRNLFLLHGDGHLGNFIFSGDRATACDLEKVMVGEREYDIGLLLYICYRKDSSIEVLQEIKKHAISENMDVARLILFARIQGVMALMDNLECKHYDKLSNRLQHFMSTRLEELFE